MWVLGKTDNLRNTEAIPPCSLLEFLEATLEFQSLKIEAILSRVFRNIGFCSSLGLGLQRYIGVPVHRDIFCHDTNIVYWTSYRDIYDTFTYASTNMGKHCLQLVLTLLPLIFKMADTTNACMLPTRLVSCTDFWAHEQDTRQYPSCFVVMYRIVYHIVTTVSGYISYRRKMYRWRPT